jgi:hypothetical protein
MLDKIPSDFSSEIEENYRHPKLRYDSGLPMELDIFLPKEQLAFEYQGEHHFRDIYHLGTPWQLQRQRDEEKRKACIMNEIKLIEVPYWWDNQTSSLIATIQKETYNLIPDQINGEPISAMIQHEEDLKGFVTMFFLKKSMMLILVIRSPFDARNGMEWSGRSKWMVSF